MRTRQPIKKSIQQRDFAPKLKSLREQPLTRHDKILIAITIALIAVILAITALNVRAHLKTPSVPKAEAVYLNRNPTTVPVVSRTPSPTVTPADGGREHVASLIRKTFGEHADKAFAVLECENGPLNPEAVNTAGNTPAGSRDIGIFQINEYWQGVHSKFLFDPETNIQIAWQIYRDSGYSFHLWTCGRKLGL